MDFQQRHEHSAMNEPCTELLEAIAALHRRYPDWRLGQLIANVAGWADQEIWDVEDEQLLAAAQLHLQQLEAREAKSSSRPERCT
jgi:hypothetical protein